VSEGVSVRFDKWLWAVRLYKTRTEAADACRNGRVTVDGHPVKPSREVHIGETVQARTGEITRTVKVLQCLENRVGAALVKNYAEDHTPAAEYEKGCEPRFQPLFQRPKGAGRPTKKERRKMDSFSEQPLD
jgi:ribosome-associated heat shock protein Hsp15